MEIRLHVARLPDQIDEDFFRFGMGVGKHGMILEIID